MTSNGKLVTGVFRVQTDTERAFDSLRMMGYLDSQIDILMSDKTCSSWYRDRHDRHDPGSKAAEGIATGGAVGTAVVAALSAVAAMGTTLALPGVGLVVAGPVAAALAGGGAGAVTGGVVGGLIGLGISADNAEAYQAVLRQGGAIVGVEPRDSAEKKRIEQLFKDCHGEDIIYS
jgi:hypothetical protein